MRYDVLFLHPPAVHDFREKIVFPGQVARTVPFSTSQFITIPIGLLSMAEYLQRNGYKVKIVNLGELMVRDENFDLAHFIKRNEAEIYAIDLHWCVHSQGAIEIARLCKDLQDSEVILGGLTATRFHVEIMKKFNFIDAVIRGEAEEPMLQLLRHNDKHDIPNLTFRANGEIRVNPMMKVCESIDAYEFTDLDLVEPSDLLLGRGAGKWWNLPVCRGCIYNCVTCGASAYSYKRLFGRERLAPRNPEKIVEDIQKLRDQGVTLISLFQDPRILGRRYCENLFSTLKEEKIDVDALDMELFAPANEEYLGDLSKIDVPISLTISPESGVESVRRAHGRPYSNDALLKTVETCQKYHIDIGVFFMLGLAEESFETMENTWNLWEKLYQMSDGSIVKPEFGPMILLDPGSLAFDYPGKHGYRLFFKSFEDYYRGMSMPSWSQWISYETRHFSRDNLIGGMTESFERMIDMEEKYRFHENMDVAYLNLERFKIRAWHAIADETRNIWRKSPEKKTERLKALDEVFKDYMDIGRPGRHVSDRYGYKRVFDRLLRESTGFMSGYV